MRVSPSDASGCSPNPGRAHPKLAAGRPGAAPSPSAHGPRRLSCSLPSRLRSKAWLRLRRCAVLCCGASPAAPAQSRQVRPPQAPPSPMPTKRAHEPASPQAHRPVPLQPLPSASTSNRSVNEIAWSVQPACCQMALTSTTPISVGSALLGRRPCVASSHPNPSLEPFRRPPDDGWMEWMDAMAGSLSDGHGHDSLKIMFYRNLRLRHAMSPFPALFHFCLKS